MKSPLNPDEIYQENEEKIITFDLIENKKEAVSPPKNNKKMKIIIAISLLVLAITISTLLIGYFKFNFFKKEIYNIEAKISRNIYQANYFHEIKNISTKIQFNSGISESHQQNIYTNFIVLQTDRKQLGTNDFVNKATLLVLDSKLSFENELKDITSFNIFDDSKIKEFKSNPDGSKYPMAIFSFYENGTIVDIKLPNNIDGYNAHSIIELIENVIPKLSRNNTEDINNGLTIKTKKDKNKKTLIEKQAPREIKEFKGSKLTKTIERDINEEKLTNIRTNTNLNLETQSGNDNETSFGLKDYYFEQKSEIILSSEKEEKENAELIQSLEKYYNFIDHKELLKQLEDKEKEKEEKSEVSIQESEENNITSQNSENSKLRKLGISLNFDRTIHVKTINILGISFKVAVRIGIKNSKAFGYIVISSNLGKVQFGSDGISAGWQKTLRGQIPVFSFYFPPVPAIGIHLKAGGYVKAYLNTGFNRSGYIIKLGLSGSLHAIAEIRAGWEAAASLSAGAKGIIVAGGCDVDASQKYIRRGVIDVVGNLSAGQVSVYVESKLFGWTIFNHDWTLFNGWSFNF